MTIATKFGGFSKSNLEPGVGTNLEAGVGIEPAYTELQSAA
jgi:hypothetical protein